jgi:PIN domain
VSAPAAIAVLDTSVLVPTALRRDLVEAAALRRFTAIWSPWIIAELNRVLTWRYIKQHLPLGINVEGASSVRQHERAISRASKAMMTLLVPVFEVVDPKPPYPAAWATLRDVWDVPIWAAAKSAGAQYVVSDNTRDFPPRRPDGRHVHEGIDYVRGREFLELILGDLE